MAKDLPALNKDQVEGAQYVIALFTDTDLVQRARKIARIGSKNLPDDMIGYFMETLPARFADFDEQTKGGIFGFKCRFSSYESSLGSN